MKKEHRMNAAADVTFDKTKVDTQLHPTGFSTRYECQSSKRAEMGSGGRIQKKTKSVFLPVVLPYMWYQKVKQLSGLSPAAISGGE